MCYFNQLGLPALIIHQVGELGRPAGREREGRGAPSDLRALGREKKSEGKKEIREKEERGDVEGD